jgi:DNA topoisomerase-3
LTPENKLYGGARKGNKDDKSHPPIHPVKIAKDEDFQTPQEQKVYDLLVRHFLASLSRDAIGDQTSLEITIGDEVFSYSGLSVKEKNFLQILEIDKWSDKSVPKMNEGDVLLRYDLAIN